MFVRSSKSGDNAQENKKKKKERKTNKQTKTKKEEKKRRDRKDVDSYLAVVLHSSRTMRRFTGCYKNHLPVSLSDMFCHAGRCLYYSYLK